MNSNQVNENGTKTLEDNKDKKEILFDGYFYDVTHFIDKHPGGTVILYYTESGEDSTHAIQQFHQRSKKRFNVMLSSFKKRPASESESNFVLAAPLTLKYIFCNSSWIRSDNSEKEPCSNRRFHETVPRIRKGRTF